ncbi:MAG: hypothetical protein HDQ96_11150 [Lachnospiraceae bacterium]|nr:hypothetical protein [Lachnospiraceae bacterium]
MDKNFALRKWTIDTVGAGVTAHGISICTELYGRASNGILLYDKNGEETVRIDFTEEMRLGSIYRCILTGISPQNYSYLFHEDGNPVMDVSAKRLVGHRSFGEEHSKAGEADALKACAFVLDRFDWQGDKKPGTAYENSIYYGMHVRGFTKDSSSRIKEAGTFAGVQKKIPYLKKLGITGIVLQPVYEFEECMKKADSRTVSEAAMRSAEEPEMRLNYWGYLPGYYMAPKNAYSYSEDAVTELKTLVRQLHKNNLEIILQFYFEPSMPILRIRNILLYWAENYHIDGFELLGAELPLKEIALEPGLSDVKLWSRWFPYEEIEDVRKERTSLCIPMSDKKAEQKKIQAKENRLLASFRNDYSGTIRCFLKGDGGMLPAFLECQRSNPKEHGQINFLAAYNGFRLADMVSYERKHNEANGEDNRDGEDINYSWNCGIEGETRKKTILALRMKQMKNALIMLFTAQGTPFIFMGDEWGKSSGGNNNPYCQDNEITWQKWTLKKSEKQLLAFTSELIALRKAHGIMHQKNPLKLMDYLSCGCPDLSYHGKEAWRTNMDYQMRHIGMMLCGKYCIVDGKEDDCLYMAYNMHWEAHDFALPKLFKDRRWKLFLCTDEEKAPDENAEKSDVSDNTAQSVVTLPGRSIRIYISEDGPKTTAGRRKNKQELK